MGKIFQFLNNLSKFWRPILIVIIPLLALPLPIIDGTVMTRCAYVAVIMVFYWMLELLPLPITSLLPVALFPILGVLSTEEVTICYMEDTCMLYIGGLMIAIAIEECNLHRRIGLRALKVVGTSPRMLLVGFMLPTAVLSMWISNTAASAMMIPILEAVLTEVLSNPEDDVEVGKSTPKAKIGSGLSPAKMRAMLAMSVCMSANIGGTATTIGTGPNLVMMGNIEQDIYKGQPLSFGTWLAFAVPQMILCLFLIWIYLQLYYLPLPFANLFKKGEVQSDESKESDRLRNERISDMIKQKVDDLGKMSFSEIVVSCLFFLLVLLWFLRSPGFFTGWADALRGPSIKDATPAVLMALFIFILPAKANFMKLFRNPDGMEVTPSPPLMTWGTIERKMPWGVVLLFGGGFALAKGSDGSGLSGWIGDQLEELHTLDHRLILLILCLIACFLTQVASNVTTATIIVPIVLQLSEKLLVNPIYFALPPTLVCSYAFMLPVSTAPNAIAFGPSGLTTMEMARLGFVATIICLGVVVLCIETYGYAMFDLGTYPDWMPQPNSTIA